MELPYCYITQIPPETLRIIFTFLEGAELAFISPVCKRFNKIIDDESLWREAYFKRWGKLPHGATGVRAKRLFVQHYKNSFDVSYYGMHLRARMYQAMPTPLPPLPFFSSIVEYFPDATFNLGRTRNGDLVYFSVGTQTCPFPGLELDDGQDDPFAEDEEEGAPEDESHAAEAETSLGHTSMAGVPHAAPLPSDEQLQQLPPGVPADVQQALLQYLHAHQHSAPPSGAGLAAPSTPPAPATQAALPHVHGPTCNHGTRSKKSSNARLVLKNFDLKGHRVVHITSYNHVFAVLCDDDTILLLRTADDNQSLVPSQVRTPCPEKPVKVYPTGEFLGSTLYAVTAEGRVFVLMQMLNQAWRKIRGLDSAFVRELALHSHEVSGHVVAISDKGKVFCFGSERADEFAPKSKNGAEEDADASIAEGDGEEEDEDFELARPLVSADDIVVVKAAARRSHAYLLDDKQQLWEFGFRIPLKKVPFFESVPIADIQTTKFNTTALTEDGRVYCWGEGALGFDDTARSRPNPRLLTPFCDRVVYKIFSSGFNTIILSGPHSKVRDPPLQWRNLTLKWSVLDTEDEVPSGRTQSIAVVPNGGDEIIWCGGFELTTNNRVLTEKKLYVLNIKTGRCTSVSVPNDCMDRAGSSLVHIAATDSLYLFGGVRADLKTTNDLWCCKRTNEGGLAQWHQVSLSGNIPSPRDSFTFTHVDNKLYLFGGCIEGGFANDMWAFDLATNSFEQIFPVGDVPGPRQGHSAVSLRDGRIVIFGGDQAGRDRVDNDIYIFDSKSNTFTRKMIKEKPVVRSFHCAAMWGKLMFMYGGMNRDAIKNNELWALDTDRWEWTQLNIQGETPPGTLGSVFLCTTNRIHLLGDFTHLAPPRPNRTWYLQIDQQTHG